MSRCNLCYQTGHSRRTCNQWQFIYAHPNSSFGSTTPPHSTSLLDPGAPIRLSRQLTPDFSPLDPPSPILFPSLDSPSLDSPSPFNTTLLIDRAPSSFHSDSCPICFDSFSQTDLFITRCGHQFHGTCILAHLLSRSSNHNCPTCRSLLHYTR